MAEAIGSLGALLQALASSDILQWVALPALIFIARVCDVSLQTVRIILLSSGKKHLAPMLGFVEVLIWVVVTSHLIRNLSNAAGYLAYAGGFATGTLVGIQLERKLALGTLLVRIITTRGTDKMVTRLRSAGYGFTIIEAHGAKGPACLIYTVVRRKHVDAVMGIVHDVDPKVFVSVEPVAYASEGIFPPSARQPLQGTGLDAPN